MNDPERAQRISAWTWAAQVLGVAVTPERIDGLVDVTTRVRCENLRPALEVVIQTEPQGFLPSPGAVIAAANRIADRKHSNTPRLGFGRDLSPEAHRTWMAENNPENWTTEMWREHMNLMRSDGRYKHQHEQLVHRRHEWAVEQILIAIADRPVSMGFRIRMRRDYNRDARVEFPGPDPLTWDEQA